MDAAVTFAMNALCLAANSGLLSREERLARPSLMSERGDSEPGGVPGGAAAAELFRALRLLRPAAGSPEPSIPSATVIPCLLVLCA